MSTMTTTQYVYRFRDGSAGMRDLLGGKGANLAEMVRLGAPVPPGFTITTDACREFSARGEFPAGLFDEVMAGLGDVESETGKRFGGGENPLLVSVRSGAKFSMPGMMDTILNLGLNDTTAAGLARLTGDPRFTADAYRRFVQLYGRIVLGVDGDRFEHALDRMKGADRSDQDLTAVELETLTAQFKEIVREHTGTPFPEDPLAQLRGAIAAVFRSWNGRRAVDYRRLNHIPDDLGTAVNVQSMVFGNLGNTSATGVAFSRNPSTGERVLFGEYLVNAQGEDVVAGIRTPQPIARLEQEMPEVYASFIAIARQLEEHYTDMQDMEFTVERGKLYMLQTRTGKRTTAAAVRIAVEMVEENLIGRSTALQRVDPASLDQLLHPALVPEARANAPVIARGLPASPGAASGHLVFDADEAKLRGDRGEAVILVRPETAPEDFHGMAAARGLLTGRGGMTSHAAVVARGMGKPCVVGASELEISSEARTLSANGFVVADGEFITIDGATGEVLLGKIETQDPEMSSHFATFMAWADGVRTVGVRANADTPADAKVAVRFGANGIGLCRTEHMFFQGDRIGAVRRMIVAETAADRRAALRSIEAFQREDFAAIFRVMDGLPVTIRTLDPPLHEFLPHEDPEIRDLASAMDVPFEQLKARVQALREANPMLGFRGCRLGIVYPEITEMQARAIFSAAAKVRAEGIAVNPEIMVPLVQTPDELRLQSEIIHRIAAELGYDGDYLVGTMIELPRAALMGGRLAEQAQFFSFGTNDLTQTAMGISRDDSGRFVPAYVERKIFPNDPFQVLDEEGVGELVRIGTERGRASRPSLKVGVCGEHGGDPSSIQFFVRNGLDYVSCSPYRVPIARLAAAQAVLALRDG